MKEFFNRNQKAIAIVCAGIIVCVITTGLVLGPLSHILPEEFREKLGYPANNPASNESIDVRLIVDFNGVKGNINLTVTFDSNETATAYSILLQANLSVQINNDHTFGVFVEGIEHVIQDSDHFWWYLADGEDGIFAANLFDLRANNVEEISWEFKNSLGSVFN